MRKMFILIILVLLNLVFLPNTDALAIDDLYKIGVNDVLNIKLIQPDQLESIETVSPDGFVSFPYIGGFKAEGLTLSEIQKEVENRLSKKYFAYPVVYVSLVESRSQKIIVYGEVVKPGTYPLDSNTTVLRAISMAGGFNKFGSSSRVKLLRAKKGAPGYDYIKVNVTAIMEGDSQADLLLESGDVLVISQGMF